MIDNAFELSKVMDVDLTVIQKAWGKFHIIKDDLDKYQARDFFLKSLSDKEKDYMVLMGFYSISDKINKGIAND